MPVHLLTASGAIIGLWGLHAAGHGDLRAAFGAMLVATAIDAVDGWLARRFDVRHTASEIDGSRLDDVVDYTTFVVLPALVVVELGLVPRGMTWLIASAMLVASAIGFARVDAKTKTAFTGFPSYWNIVVFYLAAGAVPPLASAAVLLTCVGLVFVRVRYVYPTRTPVLRRTTLSLAAAWTVALAVMIWRYPDVPGLWLLGSLAFPAYYVGLSLVIHAKRARRDAYFSTDR